MHVVDIVIPVVWVAFWIYWIAASIGVKVGQAGGTRVAGVRVPIVLILIAVVVLGAYFIYSAVMEERYLAETFPKTYPGYKRSTKMLAPFIF
jgi:protein-S-isoprenylcysteine O-methyltransferase Ste14